MSRREYKTVAMPQMLTGRRRRGQSHAEMIAEIVSGVINKQSAAGWTYAGADSFRTMERVGLFGGQREAIYTVLIFERDRAPEEMPELEGGVRRLEPEAAPLGARRGRRAQPIVDDVDMPFEPRQQQRAADAPPPRRRGASAGASSTARHLDPSAQDWEDPVDPTGRGPAGAPFSRYRR